MNINFNRTELDILLSNLGSHQIDHIGIGLRRFLLDDLHDAVEGRVLVPGLLLQQIWLRSIGGTENVTTTNRHPAAARGAATTGYSGSELLPILLAIVVVAPWFPAPRRHSSPGGRPLLPALVQEALELAEVTDDRKDAVGDQFRAVQMY